jgi:telomere length regulation protein
MSDFLTAVSTKKVVAPEPLLQEVKTLSIQNVARIDSPESTLEALKKEPSSDTVIEALRYMTSDEFSLLLPEPLNASIAHQLVNDTIPHYWRPFSGSRHHRDFAKILRNPTGIGHIITRLRSLIADSRRKQEPGEARDSSEHIVDLLAVLDGILKDEKTSKQILFDVSAHGKNLVQRKLIWREYVAQIGSGRVVSLVAEAEDVLKGKQISSTACWIAEGSTYAKWLGRNIAALMNDDDKSEERVVAVVELCSKALSLGYTGK